MADLENPNNKVNQVQDIPKAKVTLGEMLLSDKNNATKTSKEIIDNFVKPIVSKTENVFSRVELGYLVPSATLSKQQDKNIDRDLIVSRGILYFN
ncbi:MAG TPA: hypothetical protein LFW21_00540 [Rickettsia endosymbiont of Pyrocoelia pectoralis]|nr:hypothetical protein [Rickettsia endosymbiont of Pyrocoelia pectoralis]